MRRDIRNSSTDHSSHSRSSIADPSLAPSRPGTSSKHHPSGSTTTTTTPTESASSDAARGRSSSRALDANKLNICTTPFPPPPSPLLDLPPVSSSPSRQSCTLAIGLYEPSTGLSSTIYDVRSSSLSRRRHGTRWSSIYERINASCCQQIPSAGSGGKRVSSTRTEQRHFAPLTLVPIPAASCLLGTHLHRL